MNTKTLVDRCVRLAEMATICVTPASLNIQVTALPGTNLIQSGAASLKKSLVGAAVVTMVIELVRRAWPRPKR